MRILDRMVMRSFLRLFTYTVLGVPVLFVVGDATDQLSVYVERGLTFSELGVAYLYQLPRFILWSFPVASLVAAVFTIHSMTVHREIVAAKAGGISFHRLVAPVILLGVLLTGAALYLTELVPGSNRVAAEILQQRERQRDWRAYFVYQGEDSRTITVRRLTVENARIQGIAMERDSVIGADWAEHMVADEAFWDEETGWTFHSGDLRLYQVGGGERSFRFERMRARGFAERPEELLEEPKDDEEMTYAQIAKLAEVIRRSGGDPAELLVKKEQKISLAVATLVIILFGAPLATTSKRGGAAFGIGLSLGSTILYMLLFKVAGAFGAIGTLSPLSAAWLPNALFFAAGLFLFARVRT